MQFEELSGSEKAAVFVMSLGDTRAAEIMGKLQDDEVEDILRAITHIGSVPDEIQDQVLREFCVSAKDAAQHVSGGLSSARALIDGALEGERAQRLREYLENQAFSLAATIEGFEPEFVADALSEEHPQTIAVILSQLPAEIGGAIIRALTPEMQSDVVVRVAELEEVSGDAISELQQAVAALFASRAEDGRGIEGRETAAQIINQVGRESGETILAAVDGLDAELAIQIRKRMLTVNDLVPIDDREFQILLREVSTEDLMIAMKTATTELQEKIFKNLSSRAADQLREDLDMLGPMKLSDVEAAQERIVATARGLADEGSINLMIGGGGDDLV